MAFADPHMAGQLAEWSGLLGEYLESLLDSGQRDAEVDPEILRALSMLPGLGRDSLGTGAGNPDPGAAVPPVEPVETIVRDISGCTQCDLHRTRTRTVPGQGSPSPELLFIGEGPGAEEDRQGLAFVGPAGQLLTRLIEAMGFCLDDVFIANIVKCRPTVDGAGQRDRPPTPEEMAVCLPYLKRQIAALRPQVIVLLGNVALDGLFGFRGITKHRGRWLEYEGIPTMPTYHPSYLLRGGGEDKARYWDVWDDMIAVLTRLGRRPAIDKHRPARYARGPS